MSKFELKLPRMGESVAEATLTTWLKEVGDTVELDEPIFEIATDKVDSEVPSEVEGVLVEKLFDVDDVIKVGQTVAIIEVDGEIDMPGVDAASEVLSEDHTAVAEAAVAGCPNGRGGQGNRFLASPCFGFFRALLLSLGQEYSQRRGHYHGRVGCHRG